MMFSPSWREQVAVFVGAVAAQAEQAVPAWRPCSSFFIAATFVHVVVLHTRIF